MVASKSVPLVTAKDLHTLQDGEWVSDAVLACCLALVCQRSQNQLLCKPADPRTEGQIIFCETHLMQKIVEAHQENDGPGAPADAAISLARWSMKACDIAYVLKAEKIIVQAHVGSNHWLLAIAHVQEARVNILNSAASGAEPVESEEGCTAGGAFRISTKQVPDEIVWWLKFMETHSSGTSREWTIDYCKYAPQQTDGFNCGIYTIANAVAATLGEEDCGKIDPGAWRMWLACEIIAQGLREGTHDKTSLLPGGVSWTGWLGPPDSGTAGGSAAS